MSKVEIDIGGMDDLIKELNLLGRKGSSIENKALRAGAEPILKDAKLDAPELTGKGKKGLAISRPKTSKGTKYIKIGLDKSDISEIYYMKFHEFGTSNMPAKPFLGPAYEKNKDKSQKIMIDIIKNKLNLK